jgi:hypothetical protein
MYTIQSKAFIKCVRVRFKVVSTYNIYMRNKINFYNAYNCIKEYVKLLERWPLENHDPISKRAISTF